MIETFKKYIQSDDSHIIVNPKRCCGSWIEDTSGKRYLDCYTQFGSHALGWNHPALLENKDYFGEVALHKIANPDMYSQVFHDFLIHLAPHCTDFKHFFFVEGGSLAVENALKVSFDWKSRKKKMSNSSLDVIHLKSAFHGRSGYSLSLTNTTNDKTQFFPKFPWTRIPNPKIDFDNYDEKLLEETEQTSLNLAKLALEKGNVSAIVIEPIQSEGGDCHFRREFFTGLRNLADDYEALLIFDEVQTGLGLTGKFWAYQHFVTPDIICFGKKMQVCGIAVSSRIDDVPNVFTVPSRISSTWGGNIVDMARAKVILQTIVVENLVKNASVVGEYFLQKLKKLGLENARGLGLLLAFDCSSASERDKMLLDLRNEGLLAIRCGEKSIRFRPALTFSKEDVNTAIGMLNIL